MGIFDPKKRKIITAVIAIILVLAMVVPTLVSLFRVRRDCAVGKRSACGAAGRDYRQTERGRRAGGCRGYCPFGTERLIEENQEKLKDSFLRDS